MSISKTPNGVRFQCDKVSPKTEPYKPYHIPTIAEFSRRFYQERTLKINVESAATNLDQLVGGGSLVSTALIAFAHHYPLIIRPDDIWLLICYAMAKHIDLYAEQLRSKFVAHEGKRVLTVGVGALMSPSGWEKCFKDFSTQIKDHIGEETHSLMTSPFSTTTPTDTASFEITMMAGMKSYFAYFCHTECGIPSIELQGTREDWQAIRTRAEQLALLSMPDLQERWFPHLYPILDQFISVFDGQVDLEFWSRMVKNIEHGSGSGSYTTISGWITNLYPYLEGTDKISSYLQPWKDMIQSCGPGPELFPTVISSAPVIWIIDGGGARNLHFHAGFFGYKQHPDTLAMESVISWVITYDPPQEPEKRLDAINAMIDDIEKSKDKSYSATYLLDSLKRQRMELERKIELERV